MSRVLLSAVLISTAIAVAGCSSDAPTPAPTPKGASSSTFATPSTTSGPNDEQMTASETVGASPTWDSSSRSRARSSAREVMLAFARPGLPQGQWWRDLAPHLTPAARKVYNTVPARGVPAKKVRGRATIVDEPSPHLVRVSLKTDAGTYIVLLSRASHDAPWLAERIEPERQT